jgi:hypothetical protein
VAKRPDGKAAKAERVTFTRPAAERIGKVVRIVESGDRGAEGLSFTAIGNGGNSGKHIRICTFTGAWPIGSPKTVTFKYQTSTPNTVSATNLFWPLDEAVSQERDCSIGRDGTAWFLLTPQLYRADYFTSATTMNCGVEFKTLPGIALASSSTAVFTMDVNTVDVVTMAALTPSEIEFTRRRVGVLCDDTASSASIAITTCATATAS